MDDGDLGKFCEEYRRREGGSVEDEVESEPEEYVRILSIFEVPHSSFSQIVIKERGRTQTY